MDPNANLAEQQRILNAQASTWHCAIKGGRPIEARRLRQLRDALREWIRGGGFAPDWAQYPQASKYYGH